MAGDRLGVHILPKHYYTPVPDYRWLQQNRALWRRRVDLTGVCWDLEDQLTWLRRHCEPFREEVRGLEIYRAAQSAGYGPGFGPIESQVMHCICRSVRPRRIIEIGSGVSTRCMLEALRRNELEGGAQCEVTCIEPFPSPLLRREQEIRIVESFAQSVDPALFDSLEAGDILSIDSTHSVKTGSDVPFLYLEVLPRLRSGVLVHIHDIFLPYLYKRDVLRSLIDWQETSLLLALLKGNSELRVRACMSALHYDHGKELQEILPDYEPQSESESGLAPPDASGHFPASTWLGVERVSPEI
jgi:hypothetical protein